MSLDDVCFEFLERHKEGVEAVENVALFSADVGAYCADYPREGKVIQTICSSWSSPEGSDGSAGSPFVKNSTSTLSIMWLVLVRLAQAINARGAFPGGTPQRVECDRWVRVIMDDIASEHLLLSAHFLNGSLHNYQV